MKFIKKFLSRFEEGGELVIFLWKIKLWLLIPFIVILVVFSLVLVFAQATGVTPFIYTLF